MEASVIFATHFLADLQCTPALCADIHGPGSAGSGMAHLDQLKGKPLLFHPTKPQKTENTFKASASSPAFLNFRRKRKSPLGPFLTIYAHKLPMVSG